MFEDLGKLIIAIQRNYDRVCDICSKGNDASLNLKKRLVINAREDANILNKIWQYRSLINDELVSIMFDIHTIEFERSSVTSRVKAQNSIEYKIDNYCNNHENGKIPLKKCMNDLLGITDLVKER